MVLERFAEGQPDPETAARLLALAGAAGPHLQRVLAWDRAARLVVYEAGAGAPIAVVAPPLGPPLAPRALVRLLGDLGAALAPLHARGRAHGAVGRDRVVLDDDGAATLLVAGLGAAGPWTPAEDVAACLALADAAAGRPLAEALRLSLRGGLVVPALPDGAAVAAWAETLATELAIVAVLGVEVKAASWGISE